MTLHPHTDFTIPEETVRVTRAAYPHGNTLMKMRDALGTIYQDQSFASLFPHNGRPVEAPWRLALITVLQFMEELPDRQAADAVRGRIDWKYLLGLDLTDPGFDASVLCEFRKRLVQGPGAPAHRLNACPGQNPSDQSAHVCGRSHAFCPQQSGSCRARLASGTR
ncbi:MAG TPA: transposase [Ktedonobacteraceae bacterium]